jgi:TIR domain-containing protein
MAAKFDVFIFSAHYGDDHEWARQLAKALKERGLSVWLDEDRIKRGEEWGLRVRKALGESSHLVLLVGPGAGKSNFLALELGMALGLGKPIIPVVDAEVPLEEIPGPIRRRRCLKKEDPQLVADEIAEAVAA